MKKHRWNSLRVRIIAWSFVPTVTRQSLLPVTDWESAACFHSGPIRCSKRAEMGL